MQTEFKRIEEKFILNKEQLQRFLNTIAPEVTLDKYGIQTVNNIYFDTDDFYFINKSIQKPRYKIKLRTRHYGDPGEQLFIEIKEKEDGVVYKHRFLGTEKDVQRLLLQDSSFAAESSIKEKLQSLVEKYSLTPKIYIGYTRAAYTNEDIRITIDTNLKYRFTNLSLSGNKEDKPIIDPDLSVVEVKYFKQLPQWLNDFFIKNNIQSQSFSKVGTAYIKEKWDLV